MNQRLLGIFFFLITMNAFASESLNCVVQKFEGSFFDLSDTSLIIFKGAVPTTSYMVIPKKGKLRVVETVNGIDPFSAQVSFATTQGEMVIVSNAQQQASAMGLGRATLVDYQIGLAITCSK